MEASTAEHEAVEAEPTCRIWEGARHVGAVHRALGYEPSGIDRPVSSLLAELPDMSDQRFEALLGDLADEYHAIADDGA